MKYIGIIPSRYASTRFPGKPLAMIKGKSIIQRVYEQANKTDVLSYIVVATDDKRIEAHVKNFGGNVIMTSERHRNGTERCYEAIQKLYSIYPNKKWDVVINIQGDEPYINSCQIQKIASCFKNKDVQIATLLKKISQEQELFDPNIVKAVSDKNKKAIYFSRFPIPFYRGKEKSEYLNLHNYYKHIGLYAYKTNVLKIIAKIKPSSLEIAESLEQLRWIENGFKIDIEYTDYDSLSIDTPEDLKKINNFL
jgi:3-deoxy-manno-octulosonate cytidylyltransferase (CMP-KDO synthetase)